MPFEMKSISGSTFLYSETVMTAITMHQVSCTYLDPLVLPSEPEAEPRNE